MLAFLIYKSNRQYLLYAKARALYAKRVIHWAYSTIHCAYVLYAQEYNGLYLCTGTIYMEISSDRSNYN